MALPTYPVLSPDLYFPELQETEKAVQAALLRILQARNPGVKAPPSFEQNRRARKRGRRCTPFWPSSFPWTAASRETVYGQRWSGWGK